MKWKDGTFLIKFPTKMIDVQVNDVSVSNGSIKIDNYEVIEKDGQIFIKIVTNNITPQDYTITIYADLSADPRIATTTKSIELYATNENGSDYYYKSSDTYDVNNNLNTTEQVNYRTANISMVSPNSLLTNQTASNYDEKGSMVISPKVADIKPIYAVVDQEQQEEQTVQIGLQLKNNYASTISEIQILGKIPFEGNTYVISGKDLGSTFTTKIVNTGIIVPEELKEHATIYYSENENPDKDLSKTENNWKTADQVENWDNIKTFLIDLGDYVMPTGKDKKVSGATYSVTETIIKEDGTEEKGDVKTATTNVEGILQIDNLYVGKIYEIKETKTPDDYEKNEDVIRFISTVDEYGVLTVNKEQGTTRGEIEVTKEERENYKVTVKVEDEVRAMLKITKKEKDTENKVPYVRYKLTGYNLPETGKSVTTNRNGEVSIKGITIGQEYTLTEIKAPEGYYINQEPITFKLVNNEGTYEIQITNGTIKENSITDSTGKIVINNLYQYVENKDENATYTLK
ncbi:MAG: hypothetical protein HFJ48_02655, partial [Clostridia bacterium]|nr:hypothetical protein [Clostridia bacterium]